MVLLASLVLATGGCLGTPCPGDALSWSSPLRSFALIIFLYFSVPSENKSRVPPKLLPKTTPMLHLSLFPLEERKKALNMFFREGSGAFFLFLHYYHYFSHLILMFHICLLCFVSIFHFYWLLYSFLVYKYFFKLYFFSYVVCVCVLYSFCWGGGGKSRC